MIGYEEEGRDLIDPSEESLEELLTEVQYDINIIYEDEHND